MKKELSWIPLANGSEAMGLLRDDRTHVSGQADAIMRRNVDWERERENCTSFIVAVNLLRTTEE
jgi:hypothetical protein